MASRIVVNLLLHKLRLPLSETPAFLSESNLSSQWTAFLDSVNLHVIAPRVSSLESRISLINSAKEIENFALALCILSAATLTPLLLVVMFFGTRKAAEEQNRLLEEADKALQRCVTDFERQKFQLLAQHGLPEMDIRFSFIDWTPASSWKTACALPRFLENPAELKVAQWCPSGPLACAGLKLCLSNYCMGETEFEGVQLQGEGPEVGLMPPSTFLTAPSANSHQPQSYAPVAPAVGYSTTEGEAVSETGQAFN
ncbi:MAG: hypothetical protein MHM6MM_008766 [Cercozoa sp. M6MM]